jgi:hypothetical protein
MNFKDFDWRKQWPITALLSFIVILLLVLVFRNGDDQVSPEGILGTSQAIAGTSVAVQLTELAQVQPSSTQVPVTQAPTSTELAIPNTALPTDPDAVCLSMSLTDENTPDNTIKNPGESFTKTWLLTNTGSCTWTSEFKLIFNRGDDMEATNSSFLDGQVLPGESVWLALDMIAPFQPGSHIGFWQLESASGTTFGPAGADVFWVQITIAGPTPTSRARGYDASELAAIRSDGQPDNELRVGDDTNNLGWQGLATYQFGNLSEDSTVTGVVLDLSVNQSITGDPFTSLGCLNVYAYNYGGVDASDYGSASGFALWTFCSQNDLGGGARFAGPDAIEAIDSALFSNQVQLIFVFEDDNDADGVVDLLISEPSLTISFYDN